jgi:diaminopimelate epimerase
MIINLSKMHGIGNDFILLDDRDSSVEKEIEYGTLAEKLCHRRFGLGADGLIVVCSSMTQDIGFKIFNSDGSEPQMCGNGMRCFAKFIYEKSIHLQTIVNVETKAGTIVPLLDIDEDGVVQSVKVDMGEPVLEAGKIPCTLKKEGNIIDEKINVCGKEFEVTAVSMGNPHAVIFIEEDMDDELFFCAGPAIEKSEFFPEFTNVEFVKVNSRNEISVRVWERGVGETLACGTGACACVVASILKDKTDDKVVVKLKGGDLEIRWNKNNNHIFKRGPANFVYDTKIELERIKNDL